MNDCTELWKSIDQNNHEELAQRLAHAPHHQQKLADQAPIFWRDLVRQFHEDEKKLTEEFPEERHCLVFLKGSDLCVSSRARLDRVIRLSPRLERNVIEISCEEGAVKNQTVIPITVRADGKLELYWRYPYTSAAELSQALISVVTGQ